MSLTEELRRYAESLRLDFIGFCPADALNGAPEDKRLRAYLYDAQSVISIRYKLNYTSISIQDLIQGQDFIMKLERHRRR